MPQALSLASISGFEEPWQFEGNIFRICTPSLSVHTCGFEL
ncbi:hypothetical protein QUB02_10390 [Microcoleus sp. D3_18_C1]